MQGTVTLATYNNAPSAGLTEMHNAIHAVSPGTQLIGYANVPAYFDTAMFATAVHDVQAKKLAITPTNVRRVLSVIKWGIPRSGRTNLLPGVDGGRNALLFRACCLHR